MKNFLAKSNITVNSNDSRYKEVPKSLIEKDGLKIEAIGNLRDKLLSDEFVHSLESFLNRNGCMVMIKSAYYAVDGYVHFQIIQSIKSDRMRF
ncbi:MAG: hypothetical protein M3001_08030 [Staphylococcus epidermidis]|nr:hypothetical protein [Staphylococcus epidermidis]